LDFCVEVFTRAACERKSGQLSSLMCDVTIAAHARCSRRRSVGRLCVGYYTLIHSVSRWLVYK